MRPLTEAEIKSSLLNILKEIDAFCTENNLTYYLAYGTLLGAARHGGFIPWDDDIDICMPRPDYEKLISSFKRSDTRYQVVSHFKDKSYPYFFAKVHDTNTVLEIKTTSRFRLGLYVDIFPIDAMPLDKDLQKKYIRRFNFYRNIYNIKAIRYSNKRSFLKNVFLLISRLVTVFIPTSFLTSKIDKISKSYDYTEYNLVSIAATADQRLILEKDLLSDGIKLKFEDMNANVPRAYTEILSKNYGDYLKLPPIEKRVSHHEHKAFEFII
ncbi:MAG TPA: hypothetical protein DEB12_02560 [Porphyromonadaceae bacterium]|jgi:lipopolysaccharide cholinephosphotransferase|nr:hypothetical protein [Porphyromonadaceae bacterium]